MTERFEVRIDFDARVDLEALHHYITVTRSPADADDVVRQLLAKAEALETFPRRGAVPPEADNSAVEEVRQTVLPPYRMVYRIIEQVVYVTLIADGRRDMRALLQQRLLVR